MDFDEVRRMALALPGATEGTSYNGSPTFYVRRTLFARLRDDGDTLVLKCNLFERQYLLDDFPEVFYLLEHYRDYPNVLARISVIDPALLRERLEASWRIAAPRRLVAELDRVRESSA
jgi:hypothetical protein